MQFDHMMFEPTVIRRLNVYKFQLDPLILVDRALTVHRPLQLIRIICHLSTLLVAPIVANCMHVAAHRSRDERPNVASLPSVGHNTGRHLHLRFDENRPNGWKSLKISQMLYHYG